MKNTNNCLPAIFDNDISYPSIEKEIHDYIEQSIENIIMDFYLGSDKVYYYYVEYIDFTPNWEIQKDNDYYIPKLENTRDKIVWYGKGLADFIKFVQHRNERKPFGPVLFATSSHCKSKIIDEYNAFDEITQHNEKVMEYCNQNTNNIDYFNENYIKNELDAAVEKANAVWLADVDLENNLLCAPPKLHWLWEKIRRKNKK